MAYFTVDEAQRAFTRRATRTMTRKSADQLLREEAQISSSMTSFDVFLSHSYEDKELMLGVKQLIEDEGRTVYLDWVVDAHLDRSKVTAETADLLRKRMGQSKSLVFAATKNSPESKWMPWELGWFDGAKPGQVAILPLVAWDGASFEGQEYLGLYPVVEKLRNTNNAIETYVTKRGGYRGFKAFASGPGQFSAR